MSKISRISIASSLAAMIALSSASVAFAQGKSANFSEGDNVVVVMKVNVRASANGAVLGTQPAGATGILKGSPVNAGGFTWWNVDYANGVDGWSAEDFMQMSTVAIQTPSSNTTVSQTASAAASTDELIASLKAQLVILLQKIQALQAQGSTSGK